jgi:hypothetical protein
MTQEALATELLAMRRRAERTAQNIDQISHSLSAEWQTLRQVVEEYDAKRIELLKQELQARGMTWCTRCSTVIAKADAGLLFVEGISQVSCGYENSCWRDESFASLHRACSSCRQKSFDKHGSRGFGQWDSGDRDKTFFHAFEVEKRDDGYYARKFGAWVKLDDGTCEPNEPSSGLVEKLAEEWGFPPRIEVKSK